MDKRMMLLNAAKAMGFEKNSGVWVHIRHGSGKFWNPLELSADCAEMEDSLRIGIYWFGGFVSCDIRDEYDNIISEFEAHFKDHPNKGAARRYASTMVAAMIGEKL